MTLKELKQKEVIFLNMNKDQFREYGIAYRDIIKMCNDYAGPKLSEDALISNIAYNYVEKQKKIYDLNKQEKILLRIKIASELFTEEFIPPNVIHEVLTRHKRDFSFYEAKRLLKRENFYKQINPQTVIEVLQNIRRSKRKSNEILEDVSE
jgi:hypothetical protein